MALRALKLKAIYLKPNPSAREESLVQIFLHLTPVLKSHSISLFSAEVYVKPLVPQTNFIYPPITELKTLLI